MSLFQRKFSGTTRRRNHWSNGLESLETRTLLSAFFVNGANASGQQDGSAEFPFSTIRQGIEAALHNPGDDEVVIMPLAGAAYTTPIAIVPGYSDVQIPGYSEFNGNLTIRGGGASPSDVVLDTNFGDGIYVDAPIEVTIANLTINQSGRHGILYRSQQPLTVENVHITNHTNSTGIIVQGADLTVRDSLLENNYQGIWGGIGTVSGTNVATAAPGSISVEDTVSRNNVFNGAFLRDATGPVQFTNFTASQNALHGLWVTTSASVGITGGNFSGNTYSGITVENVGTVSINGSTVSDNGRNGIVSTLNQSLAVDGVLIEGNGRLDISYNPGGGGMHIRPGSATPITISNSLIRGNQNWGNGGGIEIWAPQTDFMANAIISNSIVEDNATLQDGLNSRGFGGGIASLGNTNLTVIDSTIQRNAAYSGGGVYMLGYNTINNAFAALNVQGSSILNNNSTTSGGGLTQSRGATLIQSSTFAGNSGVAGGLWLTVLGGEISNTTISGNEGGLYGAAYLSSQTPLSIINSTVTENGGSTVGGLYSTTTIVQILNSIVAQNALTSSEGFPVPFQESDLGGAIRSLGHNILGEAATVAIRSEQLTGLIPGPHPTDLVGTVVNPANALLGPLQNNGGATLTHALLPQSPATNTGAASATVPVTDQRGFARAGQTDIGAFENQAPVGVDDTVTTDEDAPLTIDLLANDLELNGEALSLVQVGNVQGGTAIINQDGTVLFTPNSNFNGLATFSYILQDATGWQAVAQVFVNVVSVNDVPVAQHDLVVLDEDTLAQIDVLERFHR